MNDGSPSTLSSFFPITVLDSGAAPPGLKISGAVAPENPQLRHFTQPLCEIAAFPTSALENRAGSVGLWLKTALGGKETHPIFASCNPIPASSRQAAA